MIPNVCTALNWLAFFIAQEQQLYEKEGLGVGKISYIDNQDCIGNVL